MHAVKAVATLGGALAATCIAGEPATEEEEAVAAWLRSGVLAGGPDDPTFISEQAWDGDAAPEVPDWSAAVDAARGSRPLLPSQPVPGDGKYNEDDELVDLGQRSPSDAAACSAAIARLQAGGSLQVQGWLQGCSPESGFMRKKKKFPKVEVSRVPCRGHCATGLSLTLTDSLHRLLP